MSVLDQLTDDERGLLREQSPPDFVEPMLATLHDEAFTDPSWAFERKLDGVRALAFRGGDAVRLRSRTRQDFNGTYPELVEALARPAADQFVVDGEIVAFDGDTTSFSRLQGRIGITDPDRARRTGIQVHLYLFDLMHVDGHDVTALPLRVRKAMLQELFDFSADDTIRFSPHHHERGEELLQQACGHGWEGLIAKRLESTYQHKRSRDWLKLKCSRRQELVVGGFTDPQGSRVGFGSLLLGFCDGDDLVYSGKVGTGFDNDTLRGLHERLIAIERPTPPFDRGTVPRKGVHWVHPEMVVEVAFTEWTTDDRLRHPRFLGVRPDKDPSDVVKEERV